MNCKSNGCSKQSETIDGYCMKCADEIEWLRAYKFKPAFYRCTLIAASSLLVLAILTAVGVKECRPVGEPAVVSSLSQVREIGKP